MKGKERTAMKTFPPLLLCSLFFATWALGCRGDHVKEKDDSANLCNLVYLISGISNVHHLQTWRHHVGNGVNLKQSHCVMIGIGHFVFLSNLPGSGV